MPDEKGNLYLYEAIELRRAYDRHIQLLEKLMDHSSGKTDRLFARSDDVEENEPADDFTPQEIEGELRRLKVKRLKLNHEIQRVNFDVHLDLAGEEVSLMQALEMRKHLLGDMDAVSRRTRNSAYKRIIHKEERDIVHNPAQRFAESYTAFQDLLRNLRRLVTQIHHANHTNTANFKDE